MAGDPPLASCPDRTRINSGSNRKFCRPWRPYSLQERRRPTICSKRFPERATELGRGIAELIAVLCRSRGGRHETLGRKIAPVGDLDSDEFLQGLLEFRNTPRENGMSPAEMVFGRQLRSILPTHKSSFDPRWREIMESQDRHRQLELDGAVKWIYDERARPLSPLLIGSRVRVQDKSTLLWDKEGVVVSVGKYRSYRVKFASGSVLWRNRRHLRPIITDNEPAPPPASTANETNNDGDIGDDPALGLDAAPQQADPPAPVIPRRSGRIRKRKFSICLLGRFCITALFI